MNLLPVLIIGAGGHAVVVHDCLRLASRSVAGVLDPSATIGTEIFPGAVCIGNDDNVLTEYPARLFLLANGVGSIGNTSRRRSIYERLSGLGFEFVSFAHPSAVIANGADLADGTQVMAGAIIQPRARIGSNSIINTGARVDHDCVIGKHVHVAPGATLSGGVTIGDGSHIGTGAVLIQGVQVGESSIVGAGVIVLRDVPPKTIISVSKTPVW